MLGAQALRAKQKTEHKINVAAKNAAKKTAAAASAKTDASERHLDKQHSVKASHSTPTFHEHKMLKVGGGGGAAHRHRQHRHSEAAVIDLAADADADAAERASKRASSVEVGDIVDASSTMTMSTMSEENVGNVVDKRRWTDNFFNFGRRKPKQ